MGELARYWAIGLISRTKFRTPSPAGLVGDRHAPFGEKILNIAKTKGETMGQLHGLPGDDRRKTVVLIQGFRCFQPCSVTGSGSK